MCVKFFHSLSFGCPENPFSLAFAFFEACYRKLSSSDSPQPRGLAHVRAHDTDVLLGIVVQKIVHRGLDSNLELHPPHLTSPTQGGEEC